MQDLRLIGVHEDGGHLLLADEDGSRFRVALDDALRAAARHHNPQHARVPLDVEAGHRPREVQALIRAGLTAEEVAQRCGWPVDKVHKYEVPILAERQYVAGLARLVRLRTRGTSAQPSLTLAGLVADRLQARGVDLDEVGWDAHRQAGSEWTVVLTFPAGGRQRQATWGFDPSTTAIHPRDDEARWFSEDEASASASEVVAREVPVYDVEAEGGVGAEPPPGRAVEAPDPLDLVTAMRQRTNARSRRGSRRRPSESAALPLDAQPDQNGVEPPAQNVASPAPEATQTAVADEPPDEQPAAPADIQPTPTSESDAEDRLPDMPDGAEDVATGSPHSMDATLDHASVQPDETELTFVEPSAIDPPVEGRPGDTATPIPTEPPAPAQRRPARVPVPSWEDVVLGTKPSLE